MLLSDGVTIHTVSDGVNKSTHSFSELFLFSPHIASNALLGVALTNPGRQIAAASAADLWARVVFGAELWVAFLLGYVAIQAVVINNRRLRSLQIATAMDSNLLVSPPVTL
jgi:hypothetical protein